MEGVKFNLKQKIYPHFFRGVRNGIRFADDVHESINLLLLHIMLRLKIHMLRSIQIVRAIILC